MSKFRFRGIALAEPRVLDRPRGSRPRRLSALLMLGLLLMAAGAGADSDVSLVDLNSATAEELESLPGVGAAKAAAIIEYRNANGAFASIEELEAVRGIGPAMVAKLRPFVTLGSRASRSRKSGPSAKE